MTSAAHSMILPLMLACLALEETTWCQETMWLLCLLRPGFAAHQAPHWPPVFLFISKAQVRICKMNTVTPQNVLSMFNILKPFVSPYML